MLVTRVSSNSTNAILLQMAEEILELPPDKTLARLSEQHIAMLANISARLEIERGLTKPARVLLADVINKFHDGTELDAGRILNARKRIEDDERTGRILSDPDTVEFLRSRATPGELSHLSRICKIAKSSKIIKDYEVKFIDKLFPKIQARFLFSSKVEKIKQKLKADFKNNVPNLLDLIYSTYHPNYGDLDINKNLYKLIEELPQDKAEEFSKEFVKLVYDKKMLNDQNSRTSNYLIELLSIGLSTSNKTGVIFLFRDAFHEVQGLHLKEEESIKKLIEVVRKRGDEDCAKLAGELYEYICNLPDGQVQKYTIDLRNDLKDFLVKVGSPRVDESTKRAEKKVKRAKEKRTQVLENISSGKEKRAQAVLEIRNLWNKGYLPYVGWLMNHKPALYKTITDKYVFGDARNALRAAGLPENFISTTVDGMSPRNFDSVDKTDAAIKKLDEDKVNLEILDVWKSKGNYILRAVVNFTYPDGTLIYGTWVNAVKKNTGKEIKMPELPPTSEVDIERYVPDLSIENLEPQTIVPAIEPEDTVYVPRNGLDKMKDRELSELSSRILLAGDVDKKITSANDKETMRRLIENYNKNKKLYTNEKRILAAIIYLYAN